MINLVLQKQIHSDEWVAGTLFDEDKGVHDDSQIFLDLKIYSLDLGECEDDNEDLNLILEISLVVDEESKKHKEKSQEQNQKKKYQTSMSLKRSKYHSLIFSMIHRYPSKLYMEKHSPSR
jgi:hypothetical protein